MATCAGGHHQPTAKEPLNSTLESVSRQLSQSSSKLLRASENIPKGADYSRRIALNSFVKKKVAELDDRVCLLTRKLLALTGGAFGNTLSGTLGGNQNFEMAEVLDGVSLCLRRSDRANTLAKNSDGTEDGSSRKRKRRELTNSSKESVSIESLLNSSCGREHGLKIRRTPFSEPVAPYKNSANKNSASTVAQMIVPPPSSRPLSLYLVRKDNFQWVYRGLLRQKVHELVPYNVDIENKLMFPTHEIRTKFIQLVSELPRADCNHTSIDCLEKYGQSIQKLEDAGFLTDQFGTPAVSIPNPYQPEIEALSSLYKGQKPLPDDEDPWGYDCFDKMHTQLFTIQPPVPFKSIEDSADVITISSPQQLREFIDQQLSDGLEVLSIDVESHSQHSFRGYSCLMQLSTPSQDYIVDPAGISSTDMSMLNELFCCPSILKILHGGQYDIHWLQTDFGIYFVNLFDSFFASKVLEVPGGNSLANLVKHYCDVQLNKVFQLSDWRERPLGQERTHYARSDSHYLYYIFQSMRNQILSDNNNRQMVYDPSWTVTRRGRQLMSAVMKQAQQLCLLKISYLPKPFTVVAQKIIVRGCMSTPESTPQMLRYLLLWRDLEARKQDVSPNTVVSDAKLFSIALKCPRNLSDMTALLSQDRDRIVDQSTASMLLSIVTNAILRIPSECFQRMITQITTHGNLFTPRPSLAAPNVSHSPLQSTRSLPPTYRAPDIKSKPENNNLTQDKNHQAAEQKRLLERTKAAHVVLKKTEDPVTPSVEPLSAKLALSLNHLTIRGAYGIRKKVGNKLTTVLKRFKKSIKIS